MAAAMLRTAHLILTLPSLVILSACTATSQSYPTLEIREFERPAGSLDGSEFTPVPPVAAYTGAFDQQLSLLKTQANSAHRAFMQAVPSARRKVASASGAAPTSNAWGDAQVALSDLDSKRSVTAVALGDLDLLYAQQAADFSSVAEIDLVRQSVLAMVREEDAVLSQLRGQR